MPHRNPQPNPTRRATGPRETASHLGFRIARTGATALLAAWATIPLTGALQRLPALATAAYGFVLALAGASAALGWATNLGPLRARLKDPSSQERLHTAVIVQWLLAVLVSTALAGYAARFAAG
ncbi:hypothetical protein SAMN04489712_108289 [Thermomonospora echinospora]|uniref:Uncharacterized protein n=1 Tax=Thermomonospora echinospora TaxID=1992 RepID=A0A1H6C379_9ACTN|nr:hypothetical protein [Thermomonospora echinospora]SEG67460.1 hypothetical protein SAMN04489712_108289 [Thermomonospora echinospora]